MKLHYRGKYNLDPATLPAVSKKENAVPFKEAESMKKLATQANILAILLLIVCFIPIFLTHRLEFTKFDFWIGCLLSLITCFPHEILHAICFKEDVYLYTNFQQGMLFVIGNEPMTKARFTFMSLLPNLVFGLVPYILGLIFGQLSVLLGLGWCAISMGVGDYINIFHAVTQMPKGAKTYMSGFHSYWYMPQENGNE